METKTKPRNLELRNEAELMVELERVINEHLPEGERLEKQAADGDHFYYVTRRGGGLMFGANIPLLLTFAFESGALKRGKGMQAAFSKEKEGLR
jgi:hypothetical protein